jgi:hypothetical protein
MRTIHLKGHELFSAICLALLIFLSLNVSAQHFSEFSHQGNANMVSLRSGTEVVSVIPAITGQVAVAGTGIKSAGEFVPGANWQLKFSAPGSVFKDVSFANPQVGYIVAELGSVYKSIDGGDNWSSVMNLGFPYYWYGVHALTADTVVIAGFNNQAGFRNGVVRWSFDGGATWQPDISLTIPLTAVGWLERIHFFNADSGIVINSFSGGCWVTGTGGKDSASWNYIPINSDMAWFAGNIDAQASGRVYAAGYHFARSSDFGFNWVSGPKIDGVFDGGVDFLDNNNQMGWTGGGQISEPVAGWVHRTTNGGTSWSQRLKTFAWPIRALKFITGQKGWVAGGNLYNEAGGIYSSTDGGLNWTEEVSTAAEMFSIELRHISPDSIDMWCVGSTGGSTGYTGKLYKTRIGSPLTGIGRHPSPETGYSLDQNFPNPFSSVTTITFTIPAGSFITLKVYDMLGNEIETLANGFEQAGSGSRQFDGSNLPGGVYYYQLTAGKFTETKKFVLNR